MSRWVLIGVECHGTAKTFRYLDTEERPGRLARVLDRLARLLGYRIASPPAVS